MRAGLFHPTTGYSLPDAVRTASLIANASDLSGAALHDLTHGFARRLWRRRGFYRMLDKMLFKAAEPAERYRILERFYRLEGTRASGSGLGLAIAKELAELMDGTIELATGSGQTVFTLTLPAASVAPPPSFPREKMLPTGT